MKAMKISNFGPIKEADVEFGDLTILVGPQASGKSLFLQFLNMLLDYPSIAKTLKNFGFTFDSVEEFLDHYMGKGIHKNLTTESELLFDRKIFDLERIISNKPKIDAHQTFYIPAHRALIMEEGWPRWFQNLPSYPFVVRDFSERLRLLLEAGLGTEKSLFPQEGRLKSAIREKIQQTIFRTASIKLETKFKKELKLEIAGSSGMELPILLWSSGQREFMPLLLGLYYLTSISGAATKSQIKTVIIEEPEMGLHPEAILGVIFAVMELIWRGYKVMISTHSIHVLEIVWALSEIKNSKQSIESKQNAFYDLFKINRPDEGIKKMMEICLEKSYKLYFFEPGDTGLSIAKDITSLDSFSMDPGVSGWGGLSQFSSTIVDIVAGINAE